MERIETSNTEEIEFVRTRLRVLPLECVGELKNWMKLLLNTKSQNFLEIV